MGGHGTHCAGTICGGDVNGTRIGGATEWALEGIQWAVQQGADVISMSIGIDFPGYVKQLVEINRFSVDNATSIALHDYQDVVTTYDKLADFLSLKNVIIVAASGNESERPRYTIHHSPPASAPTIVSVGAVGLQSGKFEIASFSNVGSDLTGPGVNVLSAQANSQGLVAFSGTSMATPHVAGLAALWIEKLRNDKLTADYTAIKAKLIGNASIANFLPNFTSESVGTGLGRTP